MGKTQAAATPSTKRRRQDDSPGAASSPGSSFGEVLELIDKKLLPLDGWRTLVKVLHKEFLALQEALKFDQQQVVELTTGNRAFGEEEKIKKNKLHFSSDYQMIKKSMLDLQAGSIRLNLVISGIVEQAQRIWREL